MRNYLRIEHLGDIISKAQTWLVLNFPVFMFVYIHVNVPTTRITDLVQMKRFIDMEHSLCQPVCFCFYQLGLCSVSYTANEYSIYHFCITIKDFFISFSRVIIVQNCNFLCVILYTSRPSLLFSVELKGSAFQESSIVFSSNTFPQPNLSVL